MTFPEGDARQDNPDVPRCLSIVAPRPTTRLKANEAPKVEIERVVHEEVPCTTKDLNGFANAFKQKPREYVWE